MKTIKYALIVFGITQLICTAEVPPWQVIQKSDRGAKMIKIVVATVQYKSKFKERPANLIELVTKGFLKEEDISFKCKDGGVIVPVYYPDSPQNVLSETVVIRLLSEDGKFQIEVRKDLSIGGVENK